MFQHFYVNKYKGIFGAELFELNVLTAFLQLTLEGTVEQFLALSIPLLMLNIVPDQRGLIFIRKILHGKDCCHFPPSATMTSKVFSNKQYMTLEYSNITFPGLLLTNMGLRVLLKLWKLNDQRDCHDGFQTI